MQQLGFSVAKLARFSALSSRLSLRHGLTLVELLVVLTILVILTTIAVTVVDQFSEQARYEVTQRTLHNIQEAILGPANQREQDGNLLITGFVADMGRLPGPVAAGGDPLRELWDSSVIPPTSMYGVQAVTLDLLLNAGTPVTVTMPCGWRGPYLRLGMGSNGRLLDGWGNPFDALYQENSVLAPAVPGQPVNVVRSRGSDYQVDTGPIVPGATSYTRDLYAPDQSYQTTSDGTLMLPTPLASFSERILGSVPVVVRTYNANGQQDDPKGDDGTVRIVLFAPVNGTLTFVNSIDLPGTPGAPIFATFTFLNVPVGPRAVQAFQFDPTTKIVKKKSVLTHIMIPAGGLPTKTLILQ